MPGSIKGVSVDESQAVGTGSKVPPPRRTTLRQTRGVVAMLVKGDEREGNMDTDRQVLSAVLPGNT